MKNNLEYKETDMADLESSMVATKEETSGNQPYEYDKERVEGIPISYLEDGTTTIKLWLYRNKFDRMEFIRRVTIHNFNVSQDFKRRYMKDDRLIELLDRLQNKYPNAYLKKYYPKKLGLLMAHIVDTSYNSKWTQVGRDQIIVIRSFMMNALSRFLLEDLEPKKRWEILDQTKKTQCIELITGKGKDKRFYTKVGLSDKTHGLDDMVLPEGVEWNGLDDVYVKDNMHPSEEDIMEIESRIEADIQQKSSIDHEQSRQKHTYIPKDDEPDEATKTDAGESKCMIVRGLADGTIEKDERWNSADYGNRPHTINGKGEMVWTSVPYCLVCPLHAECKNITLENDKIPF